MNILQYPEQINKSNNSSTQLHVWNNAAFDRGDDLSMNASWSSSDCTKENLSPTALNNNPLLRRSSLAKFKNRDEKIIDDEIAEIEGEIKRLTSKLEALRLEKADRRIAAERRVSGRVVAAKFMEPKRNAAAGLKKKVEEETPRRSVPRKIEEETPKRSVAGLKKVEEETPKQSAAVSRNSRVSWRRGMSLGPAEIAARTMLPPATTPSRRKSCFWKTQEVCEERGKTVGVGTRKSVRKRGEQDDSLVQPRNLFSEAEKSVPVSSSKKGMKPGRVVASRYSQGIGNSGAGGDARKRSLPENNRVGSEVVRVKKRWEIPAEGVNGNGAVLLPKIRNLRCVNESPRDSGAAKRVSELTGKKSYFCNDEEEKGLCQALSFVEEDDGEDKVMQLH